MLRDKKGRGAKVMFNGRMRLFYEEGYYMISFDRKEALPILKTAEEQRQCCHGGGRHGGV